MRSQGWGIGACGPESNQRDPAPTMWIARTNSQKLSSDLPVCPQTHTHWMLRSYCLLSILEMHDFWFCGRRTLLVIFPVPKRLSILTKIDQSVPRVIPSEENLFPFRIAKLLRVYPLLFSFRPLCTSHASSACFLAIYSLRGFFLLPGVLAPPWGKECPFPSLGMWELNTSPPACWSCSTTWPATWLT